MRPLGISNSLNCDNMLSIHADQRRQTGIYACMVNLLRCRVELRYHNCACSATPFSTSQLCPCEANATEIFEESGFGVDVVNHDLCAVEVESKCIIVGSRYGGERVGGGGRDRRLRRDSYRCHFVEQQMDSCGKDVSSITSCCSHPDWHNGLSELGIVSQLVTGFLEVVVVRQTKSKISRLAAVLRAMKSDCSQCDGNELMKIVGETDY